jgi:hypothetical protein
MLTDTQRKLLSIIAEKEGKLNWYKIGRIHMNKFHDPTDFDASMKFLKGENFVVEKPVDDEPLPSLFITDKGKSELMSGRMKDES